MKNYPGPDLSHHDPADPNPWLALSLETTTPIRPEVKEAWLRDSSSKSRQFLLPFARPVARFFIAFNQVLKAISPLQINWPLILHRFLVSGLKTFVRPDANYLILRHFNIGSEILEFIAANVKGAKVPMNPLHPLTLNDLLDNVFLKHDLNLYNFIINLSKGVREKGLEIGPVPIQDLDLSMITEGDFEIKDLPNRWLNFIDLETAIELYTPVFQFFLPDKDFWRSVNSLQLDETIGVYAAKITDKPEHLVLLNNKHPLVAMSTLRAGHRLVLHGLSSEMLHYLLVMLKREKTKHVRAAQ
jgi:hypothetical protein